jgi:hypothetical protein
MIALAVGLATEPQANVAADGHVATSAKADRLDIAERRDPCRLLAWPYISAECVSRFNRIEEPRVVTRMITVEHRPQPGVSVLVRVPVEDMAER